MVIDEGRGNYLHSSLTNATQRSTKEQEPKRVGELGESAKEHRKAPDRKAEGHQPKRLERVDGMAEADDADGIERNIGGGEVADVHGLVFGMNVVGRVYEALELCRGRGREVR